MACRRNSCTFSVLSAMFSPLLEFAFGFPLYNNLPSRKSAAVQRLRFMVKTL